MVWFDGRISPGTIRVDRLIDILVIAIVGGLRHPAGPFLGAILFVLLDNFAIDLIDRDRFNTVIGLAFLADRAVFSRRAARPVGEGCAGISRRSGRGRSNPA